ncbi:B3 domain-containing transcription factor VRN1 [Medicago truncatula]|uniref:B3 domain-containing transcription factor VRN1 n=1 Tax=Medicago truncatula TaxID=3880 RepID=UPI001967754D|nr:B3 domain-containing transcription factor VRN1 [Medicago truncatula]
MSFQQNGTGSINNGRGREAQGMHFYLHVQQCELQHKELMIPRNFAERYWNDVPNPISLKLPNGSACKMNWVQRGDGIWLQNWKRFAWSLRSGDLLVFQYKGGSDFHVIILDDSKLEIDYSSMRCNDDQANTKESDDDDDDDDDYECVEIPSDSENTKIPLKKKRTNSNGIATTATTPQGSNIHMRKTNINASQQKVSVFKVLQRLMETQDMGKKAKNAQKLNERSCTNSHPNESPSFTVKLSPYHVEGDNRLAIPSWFSKEYMNELLQGKATIRSVGEDRAWHVTLNFHNNRSSFIMRAGWKSFSKEHELKVGDVCKFEMTQR